MIDTPQLIETTAQFVAKIHLTGPRNEIRSAMGTGVSELMAAVKAQGIGPAGPLFEHHLKTDPLTFDFELCVPVTAPVVAAGRVTGGQTASVKVARMLRGSRRKDGQSNHAASCAAGSSLTVKAINWSSVMSPSR